MITWKNIRLKSRLAIFLRDSSRLWNLQGFLKELQENGIFEKQLKNDESLKRKRTEIWNRFGEGELSGDQRYHAASGYSWAVQSNETGWLYAWLVSCMLWLQFRREPFEKNLTEQSQRTPANHPTVDGRKNDDMKNSVRWREQVMWWSSICLKLIRLNKTEALAWRSGGRSIFTTTLMPWLGGIFPRKLQRFQSWGKSHSEFWGPAFNPFSFFLGRKFLKISIFFWKEGWGFNLYWSPYVQLSNEKHPGWLGYIGHYTPQLYRHCNKP